MVNAVEAETALQSLELDIISDDELVQWNDEKNHAGMFEKDVALEGWKDEDGFLTKEFYVRDPSGNDFGIYRKAWYGDYAGGSDPEIFITDADHNEVATLKRDSHAAIKRPSRGPGM